MAELFKSRRDSEMTVTFDEYIHAFRFTIREGERTISYIIGESDATILAQDIESTILAAYGEE